MTTKRTSKASQAKTTSRPSIYIGPSLKALPTNRVFKNGDVLANVQALIDECPAIKRLIVSVDKLAESQAKLRDSSSVESSFYKKIEKHFRKGAK
jgi:hypothetical protein